MPQLTLIILFLISNLQFVDRHEFIRHDISNETIVRQTEMQEKHESIKFIFTFYCSCKICCGDWSGLNRTASGTIPVAGQTLAGDPSLLGKKCIFTKVPPGMKYLLYHPDGSRKIFTFEDTGNPEYISGDCRGDMYMGPKEYHDLCVQLGVKEMEIKFIK